MSLGPKRFEYLSWPNALQALRKEGSTLIWPFGACEQHGPQLPLATDILFAERVLASIIERLPSSFPIWMMPSQTFGFSPEHSSFTGTITLSASLMTQLVLEVGEQLASSGLRRLIFFNAHGGQIGLLQSAARELRAQNPSMAVLPCFLWSGVNELNNLIPEAERNRGLHAGLAETSLMMAIAPELVGEERPVDGLNTEANGLASIPEGWSLEGASPCSWLTEDLSVTGVIGDSRGANSFLGEAIENALIDHWVRLLTSLMESNWPPVNKT